MKPDLTDEQAHQLAEYFFGKSWTAYTVQTGMKSLRDSKKPLGAVFYGDSWRAVFRAAGVHLPLRPQFVVKGTSVMMAADAICTARSASMAKRIAAALNEYIPDRRGI